MGMLTLLGFGCDNNGEVMYGTPIGSFEIKGSVTDENGNEIEGAAIKVTVPDMPSGVYSFAKGETDGMGQYSVDGETIPYDKMKVVCIPANENLEADSTVVDMKYVRDKHNSDDWNEGHADATVDFKLKKRENNE